MAGWIGDKLVEESSGGKRKLIHLKSNFDLYQEKSKIVREVLAEYDPNMRAYSLDEAYMDLGPYVALRLGRGWSHDRASKELSGMVAYTGEESAEKETPNHVNEKREQKME
eukprot:2402808-Ditylum_brightwellii.AAC.1